MYKIIISFHLHFFISFLLKIVLKLISYNNFNNLYKFTIKKELSLYLKITLFYYIAFLLCLDIFNKIPIAERFITKDVPP